MKKFLFDFFPVIALYLTYKVAQGYVDGDSQALIIGTGGFLIAAAIQIGWNWFVHHTVEKIHVVTFVLAAVFGGMTIALGDTRFFMLKPTIVYWLLAAVLIVGSLLMGKPLIKSLLGNQLSLPDPVWHRLTWLWGGFFVFCGLLNWYVAENFSEDFWVDFKLFGMLGITVVFAIIQGIYLARHIDPEELKSE